MIELVIFIMALGYYAIFHVEIVWVLTHHKAFTDRYAIASLYRNLLLDIVSSIQQTI